MIVFSLLRIEGKNYRNKIQFKEVEFQEILNIPFLNQSRVI